MADPLTDTELVEQRHEDYAAEVGPVGLGRSEWQRLAKAFARFEAETIERAAKAERALRQIAMSEGSRAHLQSIARSAIRNLTKEQQSFGSLDDGVPNHFDHTKRGFQP